MIIFQINAKGAKGCEGSSFAVKANYTPNTGWRVKKYVTRKVGILDDDAIVSNPDNAVIEPYSLGEIFEEGDADGISKRIRVYSPKGTLVCANHKVGGRETKYT